MRPVLAAAMIALAAAPAFAKSSPALPLLSQTIAAQTEPTYVPTLPPGFPDLSQPILPTPKPTASPTPQPTITPAPSATPAPASATTLPPTFPDLSQSIMPTPQATVTASALAAQGPSGTPIALARPPGLPFGFPDLSQPILPAPAIATTPSIAATPPVPTPAPSLPAAIAARPSATPPVVASVPAAILAAPSATPGPDDAVPPLYVKGQILTISAGFVIFTSGDSLRLASGVVIPPGVTTGSYVRVSVDQLARLVSAIDLEPKNSLPGEIDAANVPRQYVVVSAKSAPLPAATGQNGATGNSLVTITIVVHVPGNTPTSDDIYLATERSQYSPAEVRMDRIDATTWSTAVSLTNGTALKYQFTRGTYTTVERDRTGGIVPAHIATGTQNLKTDDTVIRWADLS